MYFIINNAYIEISLGDVSGGYLTYSNSDDGLLSKKKKFNTDFDPKPNSIYMIFGSYVEHGVRRVVKGTRIAIVFFYKVDTSFNQLVSMWANKPEQCEHCLHCFSNKYSLEVHGHICQKVITFSRFKDEGEGRVEEDEKELEKEEDEKELEKEDDNVEEKSGDQEGTNNEGIDMSEKLIYSKKKQCFKCKKLCRTKRNLKVHFNKCLK